MQNLFHTIGSVILGAGMALAGFFGYHQPINAGAVIPSAPSVFETYLANAQGSTDTTLTFASGALRDGTSLSGYTCLTLDSNTSSLEYECGTVSGTTMTVSLRGIDAATGATNIASLQFAHRVGADVKITDYPILTLLGNIMNGQSSLPNMLYYDPSVSNAVLGASTTALASVAYVNATAVSGAPNAAQGVKGIVELASLGQMKAGTVTGTTGAALIPQNQYATSSNDIKTTHLPITQTDGTLAANFLNGLSTNYTFNGATTTISGSFNIGSTTSNYSTSTISGGLLVTGASTTFTGQVTFASTTLLSSLSQSFVAGQAVTSGQAAVVLPYQPQGIAFDNNGSGTCTISSTTCTSSAFTIAGNSNRMLVAIIEYASGSTPAFSGVTYNGSSMTLGAGGEEIDNHTNDKLYVYYLANPASGANTAVFTATSGSASIYYAFYSYYNVSGFDTAVGGGNSSGSSNTGSISINPTNVGDVVVGGTQCNGGTQGGTITTNHLISNISSSGINTGDSGTTTPIAAQTLTCGATTYNGQVAAAFLPLTTNTIPYAYVASSLYPTTEKSFVGFFNSVASAGQLAPITTTGTANTLSGLTIAGQYYLNDTSGTIGVSAGTNSRKACIAVSTTGCLVTNEW